MTIDVFTATGTKKGTAVLPSVLFEAPINEGLMHQALIMQLSNQRHSIAHAKTRSEIRGSTRKLFAQKGTGRARRGSIRSPLLRGGNKAFGPRSNANFRKEMPQAMRRRALISCLSAQAKNGVIIGLEGFTGTKTKEAHALLTKLPVALGRRVLFVVDQESHGLTRCIRNIPNVSTVHAQYLNPRDVLSARHIVFLMSALRVAEQTFGAPKSTRKTKPEDVMQKERKAPKKVPTTKTRAPKKSTKVTSDPSA
ncbi:50S ribosomal protein L4 [Candidatus Peregrinibacteria bacterium CG10_big_fil_rev_8_21_14_0_10_55_24]|nr:MAG: 50S ribosomal protein L4 [Candidatus Peregrinibacteria bacterium CG10_big_fil_rev_8_21_14_0_10_55_24]